MAQSRRECEKRRCHHFLNTGEFDKKQGQWVFKVQVNRTGDEKLFGLNKKNFTVIEERFTTKTAIHGSAKA